MIQKKVCLLGSFSVGKTSLIRRYVDSLFSDKYLTTVGVKIDKKCVDIGSRQFSLMIWDIAGKDPFSTIKPAYLRGLGGYIVVIDGTRPDSFQVALEVHQQVRDQIGEIPAVFALNKTDLQHLWKLEHRHVLQLQKTGYPVVNTSALLGTGVEDIFTLLASQWLTPEAI